MLENKLSLRAIESNRSNVIYALYNNVEVMDFKYQIQVMETEKEKALKRGYTTRCPEYVAICGLIQDLYLYCRSMYGMDFKPPYFSRKY